MRSFACICLLVFSAFSYAEIFVDSNNPAPGYGTKKFTSYGKKNVQFVAGENQVGLQSYLYVIFDNPDKGSKLKKVQVLFVTPNRNEVVSRNSPEELFYLDNHRKLLVDKVYGAGNEVDFDLKCNSLASPANLPDRIQYVVNLGPTCFIQQWRQTSSIRP